jgi:hypothetical protein
MSVRNARQEAIDRLGGRDARVLEPSPPAVMVPPFFADDPVEPGTPETVGPTSAFAVTWDRLAGDDPALADFAADRWLGAWRALPEVPPGLVETRLSLHRVAEHVMKPAREAVNGKFGLRYTLRGFGTPFFGDDVQLRVEGVELLRDSPGGERRAALTSLGEAAALAGVTLAVDDGPLAVDPAGSAFLGDWYGFAASALEELRAQASAGLDPSHVQLWPEHFDIAIEVGSADAGTRAAYGLSPGDELHDEPYVYVAPWEPDRAQGELWNAETFRGAELSHAQLLSADDQRTFVVAWLRERLEGLSA